MMTVALASYFSGGVDESEAARYFTFTCAGDLRAEREIILAGLVFHNLYLNDIPAWPLSDKGEALEFVLRGLRVKSRLISSHLGRKAILDMLIIKMCDGFKDEHRRFLDEIVWHVANVRVRRADGSIGI
jgi:hypothetical protein